mmetsp:Transcript_11472/g.26944  ORF Transcript_11472/g.26944 Transcript_11472/m.26944 type:complete len:268 (+) Transcript_11472:173-976(+)
MSSGNDQNPATNMSEYTPQLSIPENGASSLSNSSSSPTAISQSTPPGTPKSIYEMIMSNPSPTSANYTPRAALHRPVEYFSDTDQSGRGRNYNKDYALDRLTRKSLPYFLPWKTSGGPTEVPPDFSWMMDSCGGKAAIGVFGGGVMGLLMGVFLGALSDSQPPIQVAGGKDVPQAPFKEQVRYTMRATAEKSMYWCRSFAFITGVFGGSECLVEKFRGKHDMWNPVVSGCITGAALQAHAGPQAAAVGCGGFAAFSIVIDKVMGNYD